ncbi:Smr domain-containing protein C11H11.03c [Daldinia childiae]|uniref:Smr domain-containing protein C11H11.03c n=1 Tax=Daldinia childiae TaxID=326645 RepID=UPI0014451ECF|nr:Smr domain-containing protein C11H11.03c [Daldinia childiae]KAF3060082.1 Smr domain-containing protein C11H11.03c [Daldinia childiae]
MAIPLTRLGGGAFNHSPSNDAEAEYDRLRDLARAEAAKRNSCFDRAHQAYERGDGAEAKELSNEGKRHAAKMDEYNRQASEYIFRENNATDRVTDDTIDLHGQFVEEAEDILERRIRYAQQHGQTHLHVIVGKGNHSTDHVQKLKPRVEQVCRELGLQYATEENAGRIYVNLQGGEAVMPPLPQQPSAQHGDHGHGGGQPQHHQGGRPQHHSQQQQHHQEQEQPDELERLLSKFVRKLGDCCVVM